MKVNYKKYLPMLAACGLIIYSGSRRHSFASVMIVSILATVIWMIDQISKIRTRDAAISFVVNMLFLAVTYAVISGIHWNMFNNSRHAADLIATKLITYKTAHGVFPSELKDIGEDSAVYYIKYFINKDGEPHLSYGCTYMMHHSYRYDFEKKLWIFD